jgi:hypothetical protein
MRAVIFILTLILRITYGVLLAARRCNGRQDFSLEV